MRKFATANKLVGLITTLIIAVALISGCSAPEEKLIPRKVLFGSPDKTNPQLSPDGKYLTYIAPYKDVLNLWIRSVNQEDDRPITKDLGEGVKKYFWTFNPNQLLYIQDKDGDYNNRIYSIDVETGVETNLLPQSPEHEYPLQTEIVWGSDELTEEVIIQCNLRDPGASDIYRLNILNGDLKLIEKASPLVFMWLFDHKGNVRGYLQSEPDGGQSLMLRNDNSEPYKKEIVWNLIDDSSWFLWFAKDNRHLYLKDSRGKNTAALVSYDTIDKTIEVIAEDPDADLRHALAKPSNYNVIAASFVKEKLEWIVVDPEFKNDFEFLQKAHTGELIISSISHDFDIWLVVYSQDIGPLSYYIYDRSKQKLDFLFDHREELNNLTLSPMKPFTFTARDGLKINGFITMPPNIKGPCPLIFKAHSSTHIADSWGFNPTAQWLANRGYAFMTINHRGTMGFGKEFLNLGNREYGGKILDDIEDAVNWAINKGYADPQKTGIYGGSSGAYTVFSALTFKPDLFKAGVAVSGYSDVIDFLSSIPPQWERYRTNFEVRVGKVPLIQTGPEKGKLKDSNDWNAEEREEIAFLRNKSPFYFTDQVKSPLMIAHGEKDYLVSIEKSDEYVEKLRSDSVNVEYYKYPDERHGIGSQVNRMDFFQKTEKFFSVFLGGKFEE